MYRGRGDGRVTVPHGPATPGQARALAHLHGLVVDFVSEMSGKLEPKGWGRISADKRLSYGGEVISKAVNLTWEPIAPGLPPRELAGRINSWELASPALA